MVSCWTWSRSVIRQSYKAKLIPEGEAWMDMSG